MGRWGYRFGSWLGGGMRGQRQQLQERYDDAMWRRAGNRDVSLAELADQQRMEEENARQYNERVWTRWGSGFPKCGDSRCTDPRCVQ